MEHLKRLRSNAEQEAKRLENLKNYLSSEKHQEHLNRLHSSKEHKEHLKKLNSSKEHKEHLKILHLQSSHSVEVLDILKNETKVYPSISEAAQSIGCVPGTIRRAIKKKATGVSVLIKKRFSVKPTPPACGARVTPPSRPGVLARISRGLF